MKLKYQDCLQAIISFLLLLTQSFLLKKSAAEKSSLVDFALWGGLVPQNFDKLDELADCGVIGFKAFMSESGIDDFSRADSNTLWSASRASSRLNPPSG